MKIITFENESGDEIQYLFVLDEDLSTEQIHSKVCECLKGGDFVEYEHYEDDPGPGHLYGTWDILDLGNTPYSSNLPYLTLDEETDEEE